jgi:hypothetical protein
MSFDPGLKPGEEINNGRLCDIFKCSPQGGMRRSKKTNTLVIVSNHIESIYTVTVGCMSLTWPMTSPYSPLSSASCGERFGHTSPPRC